jgi:hypothetical protein
MAADEYCFVAYRPYLARAVNVQWRVHPQQHQHAGAEKLEKHCLG